MYAFLLSAGVIFVAELGDKSQLMAMTFVTRFRAREVLVGITIATLIVHLGSVAIGAAMGTALPIGRDRHRRGRGVPRLRRLDAAR